MCNDYESIDMIVNIFIKLFLAVAVQMALCGCWQDILLAPSESEAAEAVTFGTYLGRSAETRAAAIDNNNMGSGGFGVNAWYSGIIPFDEFVVGNPEPNFMNNTRVYDDGAGWTYSPLKYWPDNPGDKVSFVAYAPYNMVTDAEGNVVRNENITVDGTTVAYTVPNEVKEQVDLLWSDSGESDAHNTVDMEKQAVDEVVTFYFKHALAKITFSVEAAVDEVEAGNIALDENTEIFVRKVALMAADDTYSETDGWLTAGGPFYTGGILDLVSGLWSDKTPGQRFLFTSAHFVDETALILDNTNSSEPQTLLNPESCLMIIPNNGDGGTEFKVYMEYDVVTTDPDATEDYNDSSTITNRITSDVALSIDFMSGKAYNLNLILGMTSSGFDVVVNDWVDEENGNPAVSVDEDLPANG